MVVKIIGKQEMKGISKKTGNDYHFVCCYFVGPVPGVVGKASQQVLLDPTEYPFDKIQIEHDYNIEFGPRGRVVGFSLVK